MSDNNQNSRQDLEQRIYSEQVKHLYSNAAAGLITTFINSGVVAYLLWPLVAKQGLLLWIGMLWVFTLLRYYFILRHRRDLQSPGYDPRKWGKRFVASMAVAGLLWGAIALLAFPEGELAYQIFIAFANGGMAAGASSSLAFLYAAPLVFNLGAMLPVILRLLNEANDIQYAMAIMMTVFLAMMLLFARRSRDLFISSVRLGFEKSALQVEVARTRDDLLQEASGREQAEASLRDSENRLRTIVDNAPLVIFATDHDGRFVLSEGKGLEAMRLKPGERVGRSIFDFYQDDPRMIATVNKALNGEEATCRREEYGRLFDVICAPMCNQQDEVVGMIGIETDVTEKVKVESIRRDLISTVSHELRTPLTSIIGALQLVHGGVLDAEPDKRKDLLGAALRNSQRLIRLVNDILDIDKLESGKMVFDIKPHPLSELMQQALEANQGYADKFDVILAIVEPLCQGRIEVDAERFLQVMGNLISNAVKHSPQHGEVSIRAEAVEHRFFSGQPNGEVSALRIEVIDRGPGIPEHARAHLFDKFTQVNADASPVQGGSGLGLSIAKAITERMGGEIGFEVDEAARRTCFYIIFPRLD